MTVTRWVLALNCGSSSIKAAVVDATSGARRASTVLDGLDGTVEDHAHALQTLLQGWATGLAAVTAVGHRVVHGGPDHTQPVAVDDAVRDDLRGLVELAPLQMPLALAGLDVARRLLPALPHVAVFDTAFHHTMPEVARRYAVPHEWYAELGVRRYGFHGTSHRYVTRRAAELLGRPLEDLRLVSLHLGNGCSGAAVLGGRSIDTTMGFTPLEGLVMGTRSGDVDPGLLGHVAARLGLGADEVVRALNERSGLLGLSGISHDCRTLVEAAADGSETAALALDVFTYRAAKAVGGLAVALGGLDALVLTGGIGEHSAPVRSALMERLAVLGIHEDHTANLDAGQRTGGRVSLPGATVALVVPTDEELTLAQDVAACLAGG